MKPKKCRSCKQPFTPTRTLQVACSLPCALDVAQEKRLTASKRTEKAKAASDRKEVRKGRERLKTLRDLLAEAQAWCNKYVRFRDGNKCISCGTTKPGIQYCAGHFRSRGAASHLRFNLDNIHVQCNKYCNSALSGNISAYRPALIEKIGLDRVLALENDNEPHKFTSEEAKEIKASFKLKLKELDHE